MNLGRARSHPTMLRGVDLRSQVWYARTPTWEPDTLSRLISRLANLCHVCLVIKGADSIAPLEISSHHGMTVVVATTSITSAPVNTTKGR